MTGETYQRGFGGYSLSNTGSSPGELSEIEQLTYARDRLRTEMRSDSSRIGLGTEVYELLIGFLEDDNGDKKPEVDQAVYNWLKGALRVNRDDGAQALFIREYTAKQYELRGYSHAGADPRGLISRASNQIALNVANDLLDNHGRLPGIVGMAFNDAAAAADIVFDGGPAGGLTPGGDLAPWAGTLLMPFLNNTPGAPGDAAQDPRTFFVDWMLASQPLTATSGSTQLNAKTVKGTYDLISAIDAFNEVWNENFIGLGGAIFESGQIDSNHDDLVDLANDYFRKIYALDQDDGFTPGDFLPISGIFAPIDYDLSDQLFKVGTLGDDDLDFWQERQGDGSLVVHMGSGDDRLVFSALKDIADGGDGDDTLRYSDLYGPVELRVTQPDFQGMPDGPAIFQYRIETQRPSMPGSDVSYAFDFEIVELTNQSDVIFLEEPLPEQLNLTIDGRKGETATVDLIDASGLQSTGLFVYIDTEGAGVAHALKAGFARKADQGLLSYLDAAARSVEGGELLLQNFGSGVAGSHQDDVIMFRNVEYFGQEEDQRSIIDGGAGDDAILVVGGDGAIVYGGSGDDTIFNLTFAGESYGGEGKDTFWWSPDTLIGDAEAHDRLELFGVHLTGGLAYRGEDSVWAQELRFPFVRYGLNVDGELVVNFLGGQMYVADYTGGPGAPEQTLGIYVAAASFDAERLIELTTPSEGHLVDVLLAMLKATQVIPHDDPLALDLDGDGLEFTTEGQSDTYFDLDGDGFAERTGWLRADDAWLARDVSGNGFIDDISELFGAPGVSGFAELAALDSNGDGVIDANDAAFGELRLWQDRNQDGISQADELSTLADHNIVSLDLNATPLGTETSTGHTLAAEAVFTRSDGTQGRAYDVLLDNSQLLTRYLGDTSTADWAAALPDVKGFGLFTDLSVAISRDMAVADRLAAVLPTLDVADLPTLAARIEPLLIDWNASASGSLELAAVLVGTDGGGAAQRLDYAIYEEDAAGGYWRLQSGNPVLAADGSAIARPSLAEVLAQATAVGQSWRLEEHWSPADRAAPQQRPAAPYLVAVGAEGTTAVLDHGIYVEDASGGYWRLASGAPILDASGAAIARPSLDDVLSQAASAGQEWRSEDFAVPVAAGPVRDLALFYNNGQIYDYAVWVADPSGGYWASARAVRQAAVAGASAPTGPTAGDLHSFVAAYEAAEPLVTRSQVFAGETASYAARTGGANLQELAVLTAGFGAGGALDYAYNLADQREFLHELMDRYDFWREAVAVRLAVQGPLSSFFEGLAYDVEADVFRATTTREMIPLFERVFAAAPGDAAGALSHLQQWRPILNVVYAAFERHNTGDITPGFLFANVVAAFESQGLATDIVSAAGALGVPSDRIVAHDAADTQALSDNADNFIYSTAGNQVLNGGQGMDTYVIGRNFGSDVLRDIEAFGTNRGADIVRFADIQSTEVTARREGLDLILTVTATGDELRIEKQFEGREPSLNIRDVSDDTGVERIVFADGVIWEMPDMAWAVRDPQPGDQIIIGTPEIDVLDGGAGNDTLSGGIESDIYVFGLGYGADIIEEGESNILVEHHDMVMFGEGIEREDLVLSRQGNSDDLVITLAQSPGDSLTIRKQFDVAYTGVFGTEWLERIEMLTVADGRYWSASDVMEEMVAQAKTEGDDVIWGFAYEDVLDGGAGNDLLGGGNENDTYIFGLGYGQDRIKESIDTSFNILSGQIDTVDFGRDVTAGDIAISRQGDSSDLRIELSDGSSLTIEGQFDSTYTEVFGQQWFDRIEWFLFGDGLGGTQTLSQNDIMDRMLVEAKTAGDDTIYGFDREDVLDGGSGNDLLSGGNENDTYLFDLDYGHDRIREQHAGYNVFSGQDDTVRFGAGILPGEVAISRDANLDDLTLSFSDGSTLTIENQFFADNLGHRRWAIERFEFADGTVWTVPEIQVQLLSSTNGDDTLVGFFSEDILDGGAGNDRLEGGDGGDTYVFGAGYGVDRIYDQQTSIFADGSDRIALAAGITPDDVWLTRPAGSDDLIISLVDGSKLIVERQFDATTLGGRYTAIEEIVFVDGTIWTETEIQSRLLNGTAGDDTLVGFFSNDMLDGGAGNDRLEGGDGGDTYVFGRGYGTDVAYDLQSSIFNGVPDRVLFSDDVLPSGVALSRPLGTDDLVLTLDDGSSLRVERQFNADNLGNRSEEIERFEFADGTVWTVPDIQSWLLQGTAGDDTLVGFFSNDTLDGGAGNDRLEGGNAGDTYLFDRGYGHDVVDDRQSSIFNTTPDQIVFGAGIATADVLVGRSGAFGEHLLLTIRDTGETLTVTDHFSNQYHRVEQFVFADGTVWTDSDVFGFVTNLVGGDGNDTLQGYEEQETLTGGLGNDLLRGGLGSDIYVYSLGDGSDVILDSGLAPPSDTDRLRFGGTLTAADLVFRRQAVTSNHLEILLSDGGSVVVEDQFGIFSSRGIERVEFSDGSFIDYSQFAQLALTGTDTSERIVGFDGGDTILGNGGADTLEGRAGNDLLNGGDGNDVLFGEDGDDQLYGGAGDDILVGGFGADSFDGGTGSDTADFGYSDLNWTINLATGMAGGETLTSIENVIGATGNDTITGDDGDNVLDGNAGDDALFGGAGNDRLIGGFGTDSFDGGAGSDTVDFSYSTGDWTIDLSAGTAGDETLVSIENVIGAGGNDTIIGDATDNLLEGGAGDDSLSGGEGFDSAIYRSLLQDYVIRLAPDGLQIRDVAAADGDEGRDTLSGIERLVFADTTLDLAGLLGPLGVEAQILVPEDVVASGQIEVELPDGHAGGLSYQLFEGPANGQLQLQSDGSYLYTPAAGFKGDDSFVVRVTDGQGLGDLAVVNVNVGKPNPLSPIRFANGTWRSDNTGNANYWQFGPAVAALSDGGYVVVWPQERADTVHSSGILVRRFDRTGERVGEEFLANAPNIYDQMLVSATGLTDGRFLVTWTSEVQDGSLDGVYARLFDASGQAASNEFRITATTSQRQRCPDVVGTSDGGFVATWESWNQDGSSYGVYMRRFNSVGAVLSGEILVNSTTTYWQFDSQIIELSDGRLLAVWASDALDSGFQAVAGQLFAADGSRLGGEFQINQFEPGTQWKPNVAALANGGFVVVFEQWGAPFPTSNGVDVTARLYDANGVAEGNEFHIAADTAAGDQMAPAVAALSTGGFFVAWGSRADDTVRGRYFDAAGAAVGDDIVLADYAITEDWEPQVAVLEDDGLAVTWQASQTEGGNTGVYTRVLLGNHVDQLFGGEGADVLIGDAADEVLSGGLGSDRLTGGGGSDTYLFSRGDGLDVIDDASNDAASTDLVRFGTGIATDQLWFARSGDDLSVSIVGQADSVLIDDWYLGSQHRVDAFELASGESLEAAQVQSLVDAMAAFGAPPPGSERIPPAMMDQLGSTIAGAWTPSV